MNYTLITGGSGGIGKELAEIAAADGQHLLLVARSEKKLQRVQQYLQDKYAVDIQIYACDLTQSKAVQDLYHYTCKNELTIDTLINNAGIGHSASFLESEWKAQERILDLNVRTLMQLCHLYGQDMKQQQKGRILNIASVAAFSAGPNMSAYYASKAFVLSFSQALFEELKNYGVTVTTLCPGPTATDFENNAQLTSSDMFTRFRAAKASKVAQTGYKGMLAGKSIVYHGKVTWGFNLLSRLLPRSLARKLAATLN